MEQVVEEHDGADGDRGPDQAEDGGGRRDGCAARGGRRGGPGHRARGENGVARHVPAVDRLIGRAEASAGGGRSAPQRRHQDRGEPEEQAPGEQETCPAVAVEAGRRQHDDGPGLDGDDHHGGGRPETRGEAAEPPHRRGEFAEGPPRAQLREDGDQEDPRQHEPDGQHGVDHWTCRPVSAVADVLPGAAATAPPVGDAEEAGRVGVAVLVAVAATSRPVFETVVGLGFGAGEELFEQPVSQAVQRPDHRFSLCWVRAW
ncbi:hypothetical protein FLX07_34160 [Microbispora bryophytorum]|nr:hypothetical protein FLX07_34160 [Microbispora bryophytorum]